MPELLTAGTSGYRDVTNTKVTPAHALAIGYLYAEWLRNNVTEGADPFIAVGHDQRYGARMLAQVVMAGAQSAGAAVRDLECVPTGVFSVQMRELRAHGGILVTGSHMPPKRIGIIPLLGNGMYCTADVTDVITEGMVGFFEQAPTRSLTKIGDVRVIDSTSSTTAFVHHALRLWDPEASGGDGSVLVDAGNGTGAVAALRLYDALGFNVTVIHEDPKPIPDRPSEVRAHTCHAAIEAVRTGDHKIGLCFDGDADRVLFIDELGNALPEDTVAAIFARHVLKEGDVCVTPVNSAALIELICEQIGARVEYCKIGQPDTGRAIKEFNAAFAFETAAKYGFPGLDWPWFCGIFAGAKMLEIMTVTSKTFSELAAEIPPWFRFDINIPFGDVTAEQRLHIIEASQGMADNAFVRGQGATHNTMDGCKFTLPDHFWAMLRPSGTEPLMRVYATGPDHDRTLALAQEAERYVQEAMKQTLGA